MTLVPPADAPEQPNRDELWALFRGDRFAASMGATLEDWGPGWARLRWTPGVEQENFASSTHGGALFTLGDAAFAVACNSWGRAAVALSVDVHYLSAVEVGEEVVAVGSERSRTRRTGSYAIELTAGDRPVASLHAMAYRSSTWHLGEDAWPASWRSIA